MKTVNLGGPGGLEEGKVVLTGDWKHSIVGQYAGPNPIKLKYTLIEPNGTVVKTAEGFANRQRERDLGLPILKLIYQVTNCTPGQWKLGITNLDQNDDVSVNEIDEKFTPDCRSHQPMDFAERVLGLSEHDHMPRRSFEPDEKENRYYH